MNYLEMQKWVSLVRAVEDFLLALDSNGGIAWERARLDQALQEVRGD